MKANKPNIAHHFWSFALIIYAQMWILVNKNLFNEHLTVSPCLDCPHFNGYIQAMNNPILFQWNIRNLCYLKGINTQRKLADITGADKNLVNDIWNQRQRSVSIKTLGKICVALDCTPNDVLKFTMAMPVKEMDSE